MYWMKNSKNNMDGVSNHIQSLCNEEKHKKPRDIFYKISAEE